MSGPGSSQLRENILALSLLQAMNYVAPLITVPYLVRVLGPAGFGLLSFAQAVIVYFDLLTTYGFNLSATRDIARSRNDDAALRRIFWRTIYARFVLMLASAAVLAMLILAVSRLRQTPALYAASFLTVVGSVTFPVWFYQGIERMRILTMAQATARLLTIPALILFVRTPDHVFRAAVIQGGVPVLASVFLLPALAKTIGWRPPLPRPREIRTALREGWHIFIAQTGLVLNVSVTTVVLGAIAGNAQVGYYSAADKVMRAATAMLGPVAQALYPHLNNLNAQSPAEVPGLMRKSFAWILGAAAAVSLATFALARPVGTLLWGPQFTVSIAILRCLSPLPLLLALVNVLGAQTMLVFEMDRTLSRIVTAGAAVNLLLTAAGSAALGGLGAAGALIASTTLTVAGLAIALDRRVSLRSLTWRAKCAS